MVAVGVGTAVHVLASAFESLGPTAPQATLVGLVDVKPIPEHLKAYLAEHPDAALLVAEAGSVRGGVGEHLASLSSSSRRQALIGYGDHFIPQGRPAELEATEGLSSEAVAERIRGLLL